ncbi:hypothetical protein Golax_025985 [Gossypium laxum]|uniref:Uncharacterized protein n=1 Tax=Gossypium laxum TaxID=34288 RepID=A0A7J9B3U7_9ROSI|nr:hypothetical protein [Gossypium laxum]
MFSRSINLEYKKTGIDIQCQIPLFVATKMTKFKRSSLFIPSAEMFSKASLRWIGHDEHLCVPYWPHSLQCFVLNLLPDSLKDPYIFHYFLGMRKRMLLKDSKKFRTKGYCDNLASCGEVISEHEHVTAILNGLSPEYEFVITIITASQIPYNVQGVTTMFLDVEA